MNKSTKDDVALINLYETVFSNPNRFQNIDPERIAIIKKAEEAMSWAIRNIGLTDVFFAGILDRMIPNDSKQMINFGQKTMSTNGKSLSYNPEFVNSLPLDAVETVIVHEVLHVCFAHHLAFADIDPKNEKMWHIANIAADLAINHLLQDRSGFFQDLLLAGRGEYADLPKGKDARVYFDILMKKYTQPPEPPPPPQPPEEPQEPQESGDKPEENQGDGQGEEEEEEEENLPSQGDEESAGEDEGTGETESEIGDEGEKEGKNGGEGEEKGKGQGDKGTDKSKGSAEGKQPVGSGTPSTQDIQEQNLNIPQEIIDRYEKLGKIEKPDDVNIKNQESKIDQHNTEIQEETVEAERIDAEKKKQGIQPAGYGAGSNPWTTSNYRDLFKKKSKLPWNSILSEFLTNVEPTGLTYQKLNRRFSDYMAQEDIPMPGHREESLNQLIFLVDVSGSMPRQASQQIFTEIAAVSKNPNFGATSSLRLITFDDGIQMENIFASEISEPFISVKYPKKRVDKQFIQRLPMTDESFKKFQWGSSGGGTQIVAILEAIKKLYPLPGAVVILTDGYFTGEEQTYLQSAKFPYKIIWLMTTDIRYPLGRSYDLSDYDYDLTRTH